MATKGEDIIKYNEQLLSQSFRLTLFMPNHNKTLYKPGPEKCDEYNNAYLACLASELLEHAGHGRQNEAEAIIKEYPEVLVYRPSEPVTDITGEIISYPAFQYAMWAMDTHMYTMMLDCLPKNEKGENIRQALLQQAEAQTEHFDFTPLITALQIYVSNYETWSLEEREAHWCKFVGAAQRALPAHVRHEYCHPDRSFSPVPDFTVKVLIRSLKFYNWNNSSWQSWDDGLSGLGSDFAIASRGAPIQRKDRGEAAWFAIGSLESARMDLAAITALCEVRKADLISLGQRIRVPIQNLEDVPNASCVIS
jgi:hypothetical protein